MRWTITYENSPATPEMYLLLVSDKKMCDPPQVYLDYVSVVHIHAPGLLLPAEDNGTSVNAVLEPYAELLSSTSKDYGIFSSGESIRSYTTEALAWNDTIPYLSD